MSTTPHFDGKTYQPELDFKRLNKQMGAVKELLLYWADTEVWWSLSEIAENVRFRLGKEVSEAGVSARIRDLRKDRFGGFTVDRRRRASGGTWEYRITRGLK